MASIALYHLSLGNERRLGDAALADCSLDCLVDGQWRRVMNSHARLDGCNWAIKDVYDLELGDWIAHFVTIEELYRAKSERYWLEQKLRDLKIKTRGANQ